MKGEIYNDKISKAEILETIVNQFEEVNKNLTEANEKGSLGAKVHYQHEYDCMIELLAKLNICEVTTN